MTPADKILQKALVGSSLDSRQWSMVQAGLRDRAFFSATVEDARVLHAFRDATARVAAGGMSASEARTAMRDALTAAGYHRPEGAEGSMRDLMSQRRLDLIVKTNVEQARGWAQYMEGTTPGALLAYPAQRLVRVRGRKAPRDWAARWKDAGDAVGWQGASREEMTALKLSPIWVELSRFGTPYPPFDYNSGMGLEDVGKRRAIELGLVTREELAETVRERADEGAGAQSDSAAVPSFNANLSADVPWANDEDWAFLKHSFGDQIRQDGQKVMWREEVLRETVLHGKNFTVKLGVPQGGMLDKLGDVDASFAESVRGKSLTVDQTWRDAKRPDGTDHTTHFYPDPAHPNNIPLEVGDMELLPSIWRSPDNVRKLQKDIFEASIDMLDGSTLVAQFKIGAFPRLWTFYKKGAGPVPRAGGRPLGQSHVGAGSTPRTPTV